jgi:hypothetical protein
MSLIDRHLKAVESKLNADSYYLANPTSKQSILNVERKHLELKLEKHERLKSRYKNRP